jgi:hypothetical protein
MNLRGGDLGGMGFSERSTKHIREGTHYRYRKRGSSIVLRLNSAGTEHLLCRGF